MFRELSSFRDPDSILEFDSDFYYRKMGVNYLPHYLHFKNSGLKDKLIEESYILPFEEIVEEKPNIGFVNTVIKTEKIPFVSYPYELSFSQFKIAALLTLKINLLALEYGMILKDASMFNVQFIGCKPIFIDLSSFVVYVKNKPWQAYYQFCKHFYAPLFLASKKNIFIPKLLQYFIDGIPLKEAVKLSSAKDYLSLGPVFHLYLHAKGEGRVVKAKLETRVNQNQLVNILKHLETSIAKLKLKQKKTIWDDYNQNNNYVVESKEDKTVIIKSFLQQIEGQNALDIGANDGFYSQLLAERGMYTLVLDIDELAVDRAFTENYDLKSNKIHPLQINLVNPTPAIGWNNTERKSFWERCQVDLIQALAIVHHLAITHDVSFDEIAKKLAKHTKYLIIEFVCPEDSQVQILLQNKPHHNLNYNQIKFEKGFNCYFNLIDERMIKDSKRRLYLYESR
jgi:SAM-dependent methyltransferase